MLVFYGATVTLHGKASAGMLDNEGLRPWETCGLCHSITGISARAKFPHLAGQPVGYLEKQLKDFRSGKRTNDGGQMKEMASALSEEEINKVAVYFSRQEPPVPDREAVDDAKSLQKIIISGDEKRRIKACQSCHGKGRAELSVAPRLEAQHAAYLKKQLNDFKAGSRANDKDQLHMKFLGHLTDGEIADLGLYYAGETRN